jgi:MFS family permease
MAPKMNLAKKELFTIYALSALFSGGRLFVGAISVLYVLSHGISIGEFSTIKSVQVVTFLLFDIPSGLMIKRIGSRNSVILTFIFSILGLFLYTLGSSFTSFLVAEFILAISLCICPAAFAEYMMEFLNRHPELVIEKVFHRNEMYTNLANIFCGTLGGYFFSLGKTVPYEVGILVQSIGLYLAYTMTNRNSVMKKLQDTKSFVTNSLKDLKFNHMGIKIPIFLLFIIQFTIQPLYHYWQPLFYEINAQISGEMLGLLFMSYSFCAILLNYIFSKLVHFDFFRSLECVLILLGISSGFYLLTALAKSEVVAFFAFTLLQGLLFTALTCLSAILNKKIDQDNRPVILKVISFLSRIGMLLSFLYIQVFSVIEGDLEIGNEIHNLYLQSSIALLVTVILSAFIYKYLYTKKNQEIVYENVQ